MANDHSGNLGVNASEIVSEIKNITNALEGLQKTANKPVDINLGNMREDLKSMSKLMSKTNDELVGMFNVLNKQNRSNYFTSQEEAVKELQKAFKDYSNDVNNTKAESKIMLWSRAYEAMYGSIEKVLPEVDKLQKSLWANNKKANGRSQYTVESFKDLFNVMKAMQDKGMDMSKFSKSIQVEMQNAIKEVQKSAKAKPIITEDMIMDSDAMKQRIKELEDYLEGFYKSHTTFKKNGDAEDFTYKKTEISSYIKALNELSSAYEEIDKYIPDHLYDLYDDMSTSGYNINISEKAEEGVKAFEELQKSIRKTFESQNQLQQNMKETSTLSSQVDKITQAENEIGNEAKSATEQATQGLAEMRKEAENASTSFENVLNLLSQIYKNKVQVKSFKDVNPDVKLYDKSYTSRVEDRERNFLSYMFKDYKSAIKKFDLGEISEQELKDIISSIYKKINEAFDVFSSKSVLENTLSEIAPKGSDEFISNYINSRFLGTDDVTNIIDELSGYGKGKTVIRKALLNKNKFVEVDGSKAINGILGTIGSGHSFEESLEKICDILGIEIPESSSKAVQALKEQFTYMQFGEDITSRLGKQTEKYATVLNRDYSTKNKTEAFKELLSARSRLEGTGVWSGGLDFVNAEDASKEGVRAAFLFLNAYKEALTKGVSDSKIRSALFLNDGDNIPNLDVTNEKIEQYREKLEDIVKVNSEVSNSSNQTSFSSNIEEAVQSEIKLEQAVEKTNESIREQQDLQSNQNGLSLENKSLEELVELYHKLGTSNGGNEDLKKISSAILDIVQAENQLDASQMEKFTKVLKGLTFVDGDSPITKVPYTIEQAIKSMNKLRGIPNETPVSTDTTEKLEQEIKEVTQATGQQEQAVKDASMSESSSLSSLASSIQEVIERVDTKTRAFQEEGQVVDGVVQNEIGNLQTLSGWLVSIREDVEKLSSTFKEIDIDFKSDIDADNITKFVNSISKIKDGKIEEKLTKVFTDLDDFAQSISKIKIDDNNILTSINNLLGKTKELDNLATVIKESKQKIEEANKIISGGSSQSKPKDNTTEYTNLLARREIQQGNLDAAKIRNDQTAIKYSQERISALNNEIEALEKLGNIDKEVAEQNLKNEIARINASEKVAKAEDAQSKQRTVNLNRQSKMIKDFSLWLSKNGVAAKAYSNEIELIFNQLQQQGELTAEQLNKVQHEINNIMATAAREGKTGVTFIETLQQRFKSLAAYLASFASFYDVIRYVKEAFNTVRDLDTQLVDLRKTTTMSTSDLNEFYTESNDIAKQLGVTTSEIISQASAWSRLGYSTKESSEEMAALSSQFKQISPGMDLDQATDGLVSTMKAFHVDVEDVEREIMDVVNRTGNTMATSNEEVVEMLTRSSAAMAAANNSIKETIALESAAVQITRNAETTGTAFRTISMRIRGIDEETEELSEDLENISGDIADLTKTAKTPGGISLFTDKDKTTYKSTYQILKDISEIYHDLTDKQQAELLEKLAGKRGGQVLAGLLDDFSEVERAMSEMEQSAGDADREMGIVEQSIDYKLNALKETWTGVIQSLVDRGTAGEVIDFLTQLSELLQKISESGAAIPTAGGIVGVTAFIKNLDQPTYLVA